MAITGRTRVAGGAPQLVPSAPPAWKLALQQHSRSPGRSARASPAASPAGSARQERRRGCERAATAGFDLDYQKGGSTRAARVDDDLLMIRDLAMDLLDSVQMAAQIEVDCVFAPPS